MESGKHKMLLQQRCPIPTQEQSYIFFFKKYSKEVRYTYKALGLFLSKLVCIKKQIVLNHSFMIFFEEVQNRISDPVNHNCKKNMSFFLAGYEERPKGGRHLEAVGRFR